MTSYIIAGSSDRKELTTCENIARAIKAIYTNIEFNMILKHPSEWDSAIKILCKHYGLKKASNPIIFAKTGRPVGGVDEFIKLAEEKFGIDVKNLTNTVDHSVNVKIAQDDYDERHRERTLVEKIEDKYKTLLAKGRLTKREGFYESKVDKGIEFFVKETESMAPKINVPEKVAFDYQKDKPFEDFIADFCQGMIKITADEGERAQSAVPNDGSRTPLSALKQEPKPAHPAEEEKTPLAKVPEEKGQEEEKVGEKTGEAKPEINLEAQQNLEEQPSELKNQESQLEEGQEQTSFQRAAEGSPMFGAAMAASDVAKFKSGQQFTLEILNDYIVRDLGEDYYLSFHPYPLYEGQCIIVNNAFNKYKEAYGVSPEAGNEETVAALDYSLQGRKDTQKDYSEKSAKNRLKNESVKTYLNKGEVSVYEPLSILDWATAYKVVRETDAVAFLQLLPHGKKNYRHLANGVVSIILRQFLLKEHQNLGLLNPKAEKEGHLPFEKIINKGADVYAEKQPEDYITLGDLPFNHKISLVNESFDGLQFKRTYFEMMQKLNEIYNEEIEDYGINIILAPKWLMVIPFNAPYTVQKDTPIFLDSLIYLGYIVLPGLEKVLAPHERISEEKKLPGNILGNFLPKKDKA